MNTSSPRLGAKAIRWLARILSASIILFWGFFIVADVIGGRNPQDPPLTTNDYFMLILMGIWLAGLLIAWKWEVAGAAIVLVAFAANAILNINILRFPPILVPITAILFLLSWWSRRPRAPIESTFVGKGS